MQARSNLPPIDMAYIIDINNPHPQDKMPMDVLHSDDENALKALHALNKEVARDLSIVFISNLDGICLPEALHAAWTSVGLNQPKSWGIAAYVRALNHRALMFGVKIAQSHSTVNVDSEIQPLMSTCTACLGYGSMRALTSDDSDANSDPLGKHKLSVDKINALIPGTIISAHAELADKIDRYRGEGRFDDLLRYIETRLISLERSVHSYSISVEATLHSQSQTYQAYLGLLQLAPIMYVGANNTPASSRWEARSISGNNFPTDVLYFNACPVCLGSGVKS